MQHVILKDTVQVHEDSSIHGGTATEGFPASSQHGESSDYQPLLSADSASSLNQYSGNGSIQGQPSFIRNLFIRIATREAYLVQLIVIVILIPCVLIRYILITVLSNQDNSNFTIANWLLAVYLPISITIQCFLPISFPILLIMCEALVTADFLTTTEVTLNPNANNSSNQQSIHHPNESTICTTKQRSSAGNTIVSGDSKDINGSTISKGRGGVNTATNNNVDDTALNIGIDIDIEEGPASHSDDEFLDEDIDERADEIAEEVSTQFNWARYMHYVQNIIYQRILSNKICDYWIISPETSVTNKPCHCHYHLLPIPLARSRLLEVIGAITMVCFIDDDVICEDYSVCL